MLPEFIITFRETLEAALVVGLVLGYLSSLKKKKYNKIVYIALTLGIAASIIGAILFTKLSGGFMGTAEEIFEGITTLIGAALLTTLILWMLKQKNMVQDLQRRVASRIDETKKAGIFLIVFISVMREGIETVIFLGAASFISGNNSAIGAIGGILAATALGYAIFAGTRNLKIDKFLKLTSILLILFAAGLVAHSVHEFQEAQVIPTVIEHVWDINPTQNADGSYPALHEDGSIGGFLKGLLGYNGNPSLIEILSYLAYLAAVTIAWKKLS